MVPQSRHSLPMILFLGALLLVPNPSRGEETFQLLAPADQAEIVSPAFHLVYTTQEPLPVLVELDGSALTLEPRVVQKSGRYVHHLRVPVEMGKHVVRLLDGSSGSLLASASLTRSNPYSRGAAAEKTSRNGFHTREREASCVECHSLPEPEEAQLDTPTAASVLCGACHLEVSSGAHIHGPVAVGACYTCHDPAYTPARYTTRPALQACGSCHADLVARVRGGEKYAHGPAAAGACTACHSPHSGASTSLLRAPLPLLCLGCHGDTMPGPVEKGLHGNLQCTECHDPHGGESSALTATTGNRFCTGCHPTLDPVEPGHPLFGHPVTTVEGYGSEGRPVSCESCHRPHGTADVSKLDIVNNERAQRRFCTGCHS